MDFSFPGWVLGQSFYSMGPALVFDFSVVFLGNFKVQQTAEGT